MIALLAALTLLAPPAGSAVHLAAGWAAGRPIQIQVDEEGWGGSAYPGASFVTVGRDAYQDAEHAGALGLFIVLHEAGHTTGITDEHEADCFALTHLRGALRFWGLTRRAIQARYEWALRINQTRLGYHGVYGCTK